MVRRPRPKFLAGIAAARPSALTRPLSSQPTGQSIDRIGREGPGPATACVSWCGAGGCWSGRAGGPVARFRLLRPYFDRSKSGGRAFDHRALPGGARCCRLWPRWTVGFWGAVLTDPTPHRRMGSGPSRESRPPERRRRVSAFGHSLSAPSSQLTPSATPLPKPHNTGGGQPLPPTPATMQRWGLSALPLLALLLAAQAPQGTEAIPAAQAKNLTRVLYLHNYPTMLFYKSMYNVRDVPCFGGGSIGRSAPFGRRWWEQPACTPLINPKTHPPNKPQTTHHTTKNTTGRDRSRRRLQVEPVLHSGQAPRRQDGRGQRQRGLPDGHGVGGRAGRPLRADRPAAGVWLLVWVGKGLEGGRDRVASLGSLVTQQQMRPVAVFLYGVGWDRPGIEGRFGSDTFRNPHHQNPHRTTPSGTCRCRRPS